MKAKLFFLFSLLCLSAFAQEASIKGKYASVMDDGKKLIVDANNRIRTNFVVKNNQTGEEASLLFPHALKVDDFTDKYVTRGTYTFTYVTTLGQLSCTFPVKFEGEFTADGNSLDATFTIPQQAYLDVYGRCVQIGNKPHLVGFEKISND